MHNIIVVFDRWQHESLSAYCIDNESMPSSFKNHYYIVHKTCVKVTEWGGTYSKAIIESITIESSKIHKGSIYLWKWDISVLSGLYYKHGGK